MTVPPIISVDDHLVEPADLFEGRLSTRAWPIEHRVSSPTPTAPSCGSSTAAATRRSG